MLCGVAPRPASAGKTDRHRLNRGGDRQANRALHMITISRLRTDERTQAFAQRTVARGKSRGGSGQKQEPQLRDRAHLRQ